MMLDFYGLREQPFGVAPDPRYLYLSPTHAEALASLAYGIEAGRGFMALVATPGMGKTTLLFHVLERLGESTRTVFLFRNPADSQELLEALMADLEVDIHGKSATWMSERLNQILIEENRKRRRFVLVIDEAQNLSEAVLETVRQWSNFETSSSKLMQIILAGQPTLADRLMSPNLVQLRQRISILARLEPLSPKEVEEYIQHRLRVAGFEGRPLLTRQALDRIVQESKGIPRNINNLCFNVLSLGYALQRKKIDVDLVAEAASDLDMVPLTSERQQSELDSILLEGQSVQGLRPEAAYWRHSQEVDFGGGRRSYLMAAVIVLVLLTSFWLGRRGVNSKALDYLFTSAKPMMNRSTEPEPPSGAESSSAANHSGDRALRSDRSSPDHAAAPGDDTNSGDHTAASGEKSQANGAGNSSASSGVPGSVTPNASASNSPNSGSTTAADEPIPLQLSAPPASTQWPASDSGFHASQAADTSRTAERDDEDSTNAARQQVHSRHLHRALNPSGKKSRSTPTGLMAQAATPRSTPVSYHPFRDALTGEVSISTDPPGLAVLIDGTPCGRSPVQKLVSAGSHKYRVLPPRGGAAGDGVFQMKPAALVRISLKWPTKIADSLGSAGTSSSQRAFSQR